MNSEVDSLFSIQWTKGNLGSIDILVQWLSWAACVLISVVGFGIVIFSIMKNALAGLYAVSPKLWDRVDEIKKANVSAKSANGGNQLINVLGSIPTMLCKLLPNVKAMTEFEDEQISPKVYFMKSIPVLCLQIFIGAFIFFGYPSQIANTVSKFGTGVLDVVFANVDPTAWISKLPGEVSIINYVTKGSDVPYDTNVLKTAQAFQASLASNVDGITADSLENCCLSFEQYALSHMAQYTEAMDTEKYKLSVDATFYREGSDYSGYINRNNGITADNVTTYVFAYNVPQTAASGAAHGVPGYGNVTIVMTLRFAEQSVDTSGSSSEYVEYATLHLPVGSVNVSAQVNGWSPIDGITGYVTWSTKQSTVTYGSGTVDMKEDGGKIYIKTATSPTHGTVLSLGSTSKFTYMAGDSSYTTVQQIVFDVPAGQSAYFTSNADESITWVYGTSVPTQGSGNTNTNTGTNTETGTEPESQNSTPDIGFN